MNTLTIYCPCIDNQSNPLYVQRWQHAILRCERSLGHFDKLEVKAIRDQESAIREMCKLELDYPDSAATPELTMLAPSFAQLEDLSGTFMTIFENQVDAAILWGVLLLSLKVKPI